VTVGTIQPARFLSYTGHKRPGVRKVVPIGNPNPGSEWLYTVPGGSMIFVIGGYAQLTTSATVANRFPGSAVLIDSTTVWGPQSATAITATGTANITYTSGLSALVAPTNVQGGMIPFPNSPMLDGYVFGSLTAGLQAGDTYTKVALWVEQYYFTDAELSAIEDDRETVIREYLQYETQSALAGGSQ